MNIAYISDLEFDGKIHKDDKDLRADISWLKTLNLIIN